MFKLRALSLGLLALLVWICPSALAQSNVTAIKCGRLVNPIDGLVTLNAVIIVRGERIEAVRVAAKIPDGAKLIDLSAYTVLPGLIDCHTHVMLQPEDE